MAESDPTPARAGANVPTKTKLTDRFIQALKPPPKGGRLVVWDEQEPGLAIRVFDSGHKSFIVTKRIRNGAPKRITIKPAYPLTTLAAARTKAQALKIELSNGVDPIARQRQEDAEREKRQALERLADHHQRNDPKMTRARAISRAADSREYGEAHRRELRKKFG